MSENSSTFEAPAGRYRLRRLDAGHILQVLTLDGSGLDAAALENLTEPVAHSVRLGAGGNGFIVGAARLSSADIAAKQARLAGRAYLIDQTHGRVRFELSGPGAQWALSAGVGVDLGDRAFPVGAACETLFGPIGVHLTRTGIERYEILVARSYAQSLWRDLT